MISYKNDPQDHIVQRRAARLYRTQTRLKIVSYMGFDVGGSEKRSDAVQCICVMSEVQL